VTFFRALVVVLLLTNLSATVWFGQQNISAKNSLQISSQNASQSTSDNQLPDIITPDIRRHLLSQFTYAFNKNDDQKLYDLFGSATKAKLTREDITSEFQKLRKAFHSIESGSYNYSTLAATKGNARVFVLHYEIEFSPQSEFGDEGELKITLAIRSDSYQVYGIRLSAV
jgi:hypothetical protein